MSAQLNNTFCVFPFIQTVIRTDGSLGPCCRMKTSENIQNTTIKQFWNSSIIKNIRDNMINGKKISGCQYCYDEEAKTGSSMRTDTLKEYKFFSPNYYHQLLDYYKFKDSIFPDRLEMHLGNLCNLKCLTCSPKDSSAFLTEDRILNISNYNQKDYQLSDSIINQTLKSAIDHDIKILDLRGGESMLVPDIKKILFDWPHDHASRITLRVQTNCTILDDQWLSIFKKFKNLDVMMSIDAYGDDNDYIRFPSKWSDIERNVTTLINLPNTKSYINCTVSNLNFLLLPKLINWVRNNKIYFHWSPVKFPEYFQYTNMPKELFNLGKQQLVDYPEVAGIITQEYNDSMWDEFCNMISRRDLYRKNSIFDIIPDFKPYWRN